MQVHINRGFQFAEEAGLCIVLGSRCSVSPACDMPISVGESGRDLVVVNLQQTAADAHSTLRIGATIDQVMVPLMERLGMHIPEFELCRRVVVERADGQIRVRGVDCDETPNDLLWNVQLGYGGVCDEALPKAVMQFNQDATTNSMKQCPNDQSRPRPGQQAWLVQFPWHREDSRAMVEMKGDSHTEWMVSPDVCDFCDGEIQLEPDTPPSIFNAGERHGPLLQHGQ